MTVYSIEGYPRTLARRANPTPAPAIVAMDRARTAAKFWLHDLSVAVGAGFPAHEIGAIIRHLRSQRDFLEGKWHEHFGN
jgi:hypothetical protein